MRLKYKKAKAVSKAETKPEVKPEEDWDFDMSLYEEEDRAYPQLQTVKKGAKPPITYLRSRFSPSQFELEGIEQIKTQISEYGIKVAGRTQDIEDLRIFYGCLNEYWARIHDIYGFNLIDQVESAKKKCEENLIDSNDESISPQVYIDLLYLRDLLYAIAQRSNLGIEVERSKTYANRAEKQITQ